MTDIKIYTYMIPPALPEVGQPVPECNLQYFKYDAADPAQLHIPDDHHLEPPAEQMGCKVHIHCRVINIVHNVGRMLWCPNPAVISVTLLR